MKVRREGGKGLTLRKTADSSSSKKEGREIVFGGLGLEKVWQQEGKRGCQGHLATQRQQKGWAEVTDTLLWGPFQGQACALQDSVPGGAIFILSS